MYENGKRIGMSGDVTTQGIADGNRSGAMLDLASVMHAREKIVDESSLAGERAAATVAHALYVSLPLNDQDAIIEGRLRILVDRVGNQVRTPVNGHVAIEQKTIFVPVSKAPQSGQNGHVNGVK